MSTPVIEKQNVFDTIYAEETQPEEDLSKKAHVVSAVGNEHLWNFVCAAVGRGITSQEFVNIARQAGEEIVALCKYRWIPTEVVGGHEVCGACMAIASNWISEDESHG